MKKIFLYKYLFIIFVLCGFFLSFAKESLAVGLCKFTYPQCNGTCDSGTCKKALDWEGNPTGSCYCSTPPPINTPTPPPCRTLGQSCSTSSPCCSSNVCWGGVCKGPCDTSLPLNYCENVCVFGVPGMAVIWCAVNDTCYLNDANRVAIFGGVAQDVGTRYCPGSGVPTPTSYCHPIFCYNAPNPIYCPGFVPGANCSYAGNCDNCGGIDCGWCDGGTPPPSGPTPTPGCTENCFTDPRYLTTCYNDTFGICTNTQWCYGSVYPNCGTECSGYAIGTTYPAPNECGTCDGCNNAPTFTSLVIKNADGGVVAGESGGTTLRNHICQTTFQNSSSSKKVIFEASVNDLDGATDIDTATLTWNGRNYSMTKGYSSGTGATMVVTVDYSIFSATVTDVYDLFVTVTDIYDASSGSVDTDRDWKVWDCYIPTSGTLYNGSAGQACFTGLGFSVPIDVGVSFDSLIFNNNNVSVRVFTVSKPSNYGGNYIVWGEIYHPRINKGTLYNENGDLLATGRVTRITDLGAGTAAQCPSNEFVIGNGIQALISAYSVNPEAQIDFSFIRDQEAWYQVVGAGVKSRNRLEYGVPVTAPLESKFLTLSSATNGNGLVSATDFNNINGNNNNEFGSPNNWYVLRNTNDLDIYNYNYFYNNFFVKAGVGVTGTDWAGKPENGIYLVKNSLNITSDFVLVDTTKTMMVIVNGDITIQPNVTRLDGIYIADGSINVGGISDNQLNINGMLYAGSDVKLYRSFTDKTDNNTTPAVKVNYSPGLIFNLPPEILRGLSGWREE